MRSASPLKAGAARRLAEAHAALVVQHGTPERELGNKPDPLDEAIYIILSFQTDLSRLTSVWSQLRTAYHGDCQTVAPHSGWRLRTSNPARTSEWSTPAIRLGV